MECQSVLSAGLPSARRSRKKEGLIAAAYVAGLLIVALYFAFQRCVNVDFVCTNGDFQTYNVLKRVLAGQVPYRDFANYLGIGPLLLCTPLLSIHNTFLGSLFVTHFVVAVLFILYVFVLFYLVSGQKHLSMVISLMLPKLVLMRTFTMIPIWFADDDARINPVDQALNLLVKPNNSMRMARIFLPVLFVLLAMLALRLYRKKQGTAGELAVLLRDPRVCAYVGGAIGLGMTWSNDFGFGCIGSASAILLVMAIVDAATLHDAKRGFMRFLGYLPALLGGMIISALIASGGHLSSYFAFTAGVGARQWSYFGLKPEDKVHSVSELLRDVRFDFALAAILLAMGWCLYRMIAKKLKNEDILFGFLALSIFAGAFVYIIGSGGYNFTEGVEATVFLTLCALAVRGLWALLRKPVLQKAVMGAAYAAGAAYLLFMAVLTVGSAQDVQRSNDPSSEYYVASMEGVTQYAPALHEMRQLVGSGPVFSTYSTMLDLDMGVFQPTGCDYIIHALGEQQEQDYVDQFTAGNYPYVQTINQDAWCWEGWVIRENWPFYRQLYENYQSVGAPSFWRIWEKYPAGETGVKDVKVTAAVEKLSDTCTRILLTGDTKELCTVDLEISYASDYVMTPARLQTWHRSVYANETNMLLISQGEFSGYFVPEDQKHRPFGVMLRDGKGELILSSLPENCTTLTVDSVTVKNVYKTV